MFGTPVDWHTSITAALQEVGGRAGIDADWPAVASAWRALYHPTLSQVVRGKPPFQSLDALHRRMLTRWRLGRLPLSDAHREELAGPGTG